jgi:hypothetical protein
MPDKRDMHKAKSHRNSKSTKQQQHPATTRAAAPGPVAPAPTATINRMAEPEEALTPDLRGKKNKSRR